MKTKASTTYGADEPSGLFRGVRDVKAQAAHAVHARCEPAGVWGREVRVAVAG